ncbi:hypothetical protein ACNQGB_13420 [Flavobacterium sp. XS1P32]|uniref:hypothetical protein n=1 Tax=Flavobacterium sp. XS1P32 TaxID=3401726 RepID=UPI003AAC6BAB
MKKKFFVIIVMYFGFISNAQTSGVEKSVFNLQSGFLGAWINHESRLSNELALRAEVGFDTGIRGGSLVGSTIVGFSPVLSVEPRWYYNIKTRESKSKYVKKNSANFITIGIKYNPDWFVISTTDNLSVAEQISFIPKWGIRRSIAKSKFNYEVGLGIGKRYLIDFEQWETAADLHLRLGYSF